MAGFHAGRVVLESASRWEFERGAKALVGDHSL